MTSKRAYEQLSESERRSPICLRRYSSCSMVCCASLEAIG